MRDVEDIDLKELIEHETGEKFNNQGYIKCPFHVEKTASMSVKFIPNANKERYHCWGCNSKGDALDFITRFKNVEYKKAREYLGLEIEKTESEKFEDKIKTFIDQQLRGYKKGYELLGIFTFVDKNNKPMYCKAKFLKPDERKETPYYSLENGKVVNKRIPEEIPYNYYDLSKGISKNKIIVFVEGEKDVNTITKILDKNEFVATSIKGFKYYDKIRTENMRIYVLGDTGEAGRKYILNIKKEFFNVASEFKIIKLPAIESLGDNADVTDWLESGHTKEELLNVFDTTMDLKLDKFIREFTFDNKGLLDRFKSIYGDRIKYVSELGFFIVWDNKKWNIEQREEIGRKAAEYLYNLIDKVDKYLSTLHAILSKNEDDSKLKDKIKSFEGILKKLKTLKPIRDIKEHFIEIADIVDQSKLDSNINLLNCQNGMLNLKTMKLLPHDPEEFCTKITNVNYNPKAECKNFLSSLDWIFPNEDTRKELQKSYGYSLTGNTSHEKLFLLHGKGENGKSTITAPLKDIMGSYYGSLNAKSLEPKKDSSAASSDFAKLINTRVVVSSEPSKKQRLDDGMLKTLASGESLNARFMRQDEFTYSPKFKLWIPTNVLPYVNNTEHGFWRRFIIFPCKNKPKKKIAGYYDLYIKNTELEGILIWMLEGLKLLKQEGFQPTSEMVTALEDYKIDVNPVEEFIKQCCFLDESEKILTSDLLNKFNKWANIEGYTEMKVKTFRNNLVDIGFEVRSSTGNKSYVFGISELEPVMDSSKPFKKVYQLALNSN